MNTHTLEMFQRCHPQPVAELNYTAQGLVTFIWDQGLCGSCWAFAANAVIEGQAAKKYRSSKGTPLLLKLSEQQLLDCTRDYDNDHCNGGDPAMAWQYLGHYGSNRASQYAYTSDLGDDGNDVCKFNASAQLAFHVAQQDGQSGQTSSNANYGQFKPLDVDAILSGLKRIGPLAASMNAKSHLFALYKSGIYKEKSCPIGKRDHSVTIVGYGTDKCTGLDFWIIKNSWGQSWGQHGYGLVARGVNQCGIEEDVLFTTLAQGNSNQAGSKTINSNALRGGNETASIKLASKKIM